MKVKTLFALLLSVLSVALTACGSPNYTPDNSNPSGTSEQSSQSVVSSEESTSALLGSQWIGSLGTYFIEENLVKDPNGNIDVGEQNSDGLYVSTTYRRAGYQIKFWDDATDTKIVLCNKPNCKHDRCRTTASKNLTRRVNKYFWIHEFDGQKVEMTPCNLLTKSLWKKYCNCNDFVLQWIM